MAKFALTGSGKGSGRREIQCTPEEFAANWDAIFKKNNKKKEESKEEAAPGKKGD